MPLKVTLEKSVSGCLYARSNIGDIQTPFVAEDIDHWDIPNSSDFSKSISGYLQLSSSLYTEVPKFHICNQIAPRSKAMVLTTVRDNPAWPTASGSAGHIGDIYPYANTDGVLLAAVRNPGFKRLYFAEYNDAVANSFGLVVAETPQGGTYNFWLFLNEHDIIGYEDTPNGMFDWSATTITRNNGYIGIEFDGLNGIVYIESFFAMTDRYIIINGLSDGDSVELRKLDTTVLTSALSSSGTAILDIHKLCIYDIYTLVVVRNSVDLISHIATSGNYICGGDIFTFTSQNILEDKVNSLLIQQLKKQNGDDSEYIPPVITIESEPSESEVTEITLRRNISGCLYARNVDGDYPNPFVSGDELHWDKRSYVSLSISSGRLKYYFAKANQDTYQLRNNQVPMRSKALIYSTQQFIADGWHSSAGLAIHVHDVTEWDAIGFHFLTCRSQTAHLVEHVDDVHSKTLDSVSTGSVPCTGTWDFWLYADGFNISEYDTRNNTDLSGTSLIYDEGYLGWRPGGWYGTSYLRNYFGMADRYITVIGLITGDSVELRKANDDVIVSASESGGTAILDIYKKVPTEFYKLVIIRESIDILEYAASVGDYICGGDEYEVLTPRNILEEKVQSLLITQFKKQYL